MSESYHATCITTEIRRILQIEEDISIGHQTNHMQERTWSLSISFQNYDSQEGTGKFICKPSILDEKQLHLNRIDQEAIKVLSSLELYQCYNTCHF